MKLQKHLDWLGTGKTAWRVKGGRILGPFCYTRTEAILAWLHANFPKRFGKWYR